MGYNFDGNPLPFGMPLWDVKEIPFPVEFPNRKFPPGILLQCEVEMLLEHARGKDLVIDFGTNRGLSASVMSMTAKRVITIDVYMKYNGLRIEDISKDLKDFKNVTLIECDTNLYAQTFNEEADLVFIDALHDYASVKSNFESWFPKVKVGGEILFHDYQALFYEDVVKYVREEILLRRDLKLIDKKGTIIAFEKRGFNA